MRLGGRQIHESLRRRLGNNPLSVAHKFYNFPVPSLTKASHLKFYTFLQPGSCRLAYVGRCLMEHGRHNSRSLLCRLMPCPRHLAYRPVPGTALALAVMVSLLTLGSCTPAKVIITKRYASVWVSRASSLSALPRLPPLFIISRYTSQHQKPPPQHPLRKAALPSIRARYSQRPATPTVLEANLTVGASPNQTAEVNPSSPSASPLKRARPRRTVTGGLKNLPVTPPANELLNRAVRLSKWLKVGVRG
jgi:hypothetical protein